VGEGVGEGVVDEGPTAGDEGVSILIVDGSRCIAARHAQLPADVFY